MKNKIGMANFDDEPLYMIPPCYYYHVCCDCGLRHIVIVEKYKKGIKIGFARDHYATEDIRKMRGIEIRRKK